MWREIFLISFLIFGSLVFLSTEILSLFKMFSFKPLCVFWGVAVVMALTLNVMARKRRLVWDLPGIFSFSTVEKSLLVFIVLEAGILAVIAFIVPPNTWDAMTYHMSRVAHWIQNSSVVFYPTNIDRQLFINPFAEYWIAHFQILLKGSDYFANTIQWLSMVGSLVGISLITKEIGLGRLAQILSVFLVITLPNAIVESNSTQTDFVATLWTVIGVYFILRSINHGQTKNALAAAVAVFLAFYTKGSTLFILVPFIVWMVIDGLTVKIKQSSRIRRQFLWHIGLVVLAAVLSNGIFMAKNNFFMGSPFSPGEKAHIVNIANPKEIISNNLLHYGMHLRLGIDPIDDVVTAAAVEKLHNLMGYTTQNSPANFPGLKLNYVDFPFYEDEIPNFIFSLILMFGFIWFLIFRKREWGTFKGKFFWMTFLCFFILNSLVKWSPFDGRYHLAFFILFAPFLAEIFAARKKGGLIALCVLFVVLTIPFIFFNSSKPFVGGNLPIFYKKEPKYGGPSILKAERQYKYFYNHPAVGLPFILAMKGIMSSGCREIGIRTGGDTWEYLLWASLQQSGERFRIEHVLVTNSSKALQYPLGEFSPCMIVTDNPEDDYLIYLGKFYVMVANYGEFNLYIPADRLKGGL